MVLINARLDAQTADAAIVATAADDADPTVAQRRHDAQRELPSHEQPMDLLPPPPPYPPTSYGPSTKLH
jgi:hypothetical protein